MAEFNDKINELSYDVLKYLIINYSEQNNEFRTFVETHFTSDYVKINDIYGVFDALSVENEYTITETLTKYFDNIKSLIKNPNIAIELIMKFYIHEDEISPLLPNVDDYCDDSEDYINDFYNYEVLDWEHYCYIAGELFIEYAVLCENKEFVISKIMEIYSINPNRLEQIAKSVKNYLNIDQIRKLFNIIERDIAEPDWYYYTSLMILAKSIPDGALFEKIAFKSNYLNVSIDDIVDVYIKEKNYQIAIERLASYTSNNKYDENKKLYKLLTIFTGTDDKKNQVIIAKKLFSYSPSIAKLDELVNIVGEDIREELISAQIEEILNEKSVLGFTQRILFIIIFNKIQAENYIINNFDKVKTLSDNGVAKIIEAMLNSNIFLPVTLIYRIKILAILEKS